MGRIELESFVWRRRLPHIQRWSRTYFITFVTRNRAILSANDRDIVLQTILSGHARSYDLYVAVIMPDHVHFIATIYETTTISDTMKFIKSSSAGQIGHRVWQPEYFDYILRHDENLRKKGEYVVNNPVRARLVDSPGEYRWIWRFWVEGERR